MQERQVTIGDETFQLDDPFMVLATQNPVEQEGTYPLPEAQVDRFMMKLKITYPTKAEEKEILKRMARSKVNTQVNPIIQPEDVIRLRELADEIFMDEKIEDYIVDLIEATRDPAAYGMDIKQLIRYGASAAGDDFPDDGGEGQRVARRPRLRHSAGRQNDRPRCVAPSRHPNLRS